MKICETGKKSYNKKDALSAINRRYKSKYDNPKDKNKSLRVYQCEICNLWHLTSMPLENFVDFKSPQNKNQSK